ncbi:hypothetical protein VNO77_44310 [Canavalia gladiata]|uniref:Bifunctional inhibitor/plant lipid transfer protein/seed storage helical domain-containing protein n=1 Tax=Canavalia gladiata TaxID=3824 RepID=A0AAN9JXZ0_CANGL
MKKQQHSRGGWLCLLVLMVGGCIHRANGAEDLTQKCSQVVQKVFPCLEFATGKETTPKKECCDAASEIKDSNPECLCFIIQETHKGSPEIKKLGIQEDKLLQLPSVCNVKNASISNCPKLLGLSPTSPDAAIFTNSSKVTPTSPSTQTTSQNASFGSMVRPLMMTEVMMVVIAIVVVVIPTGFVSIYT